MTIFPLTSPLTINRCKRYITLNQHLNQICINIHAINILDIITFAESHVTFVVGSGFYICGKCIMFVELLHLKLQIFITFVDIITLAVITSIPKLRGIKILNESFISVLCVCVFLRVYSFDVQMSWLALDHVADVQIIIHFC